jgi:hypothetical protein
MLSRLFDADGTPRDPALWLVLAGVAASLLLAFWVVCVQQVQRAEARHTAAARVQLAGSRDCARTVGSAVRCDAQSAAAGALQMGSRIR